MGFPFGGPIRGRYQKCFRPTSHSSIDSGIRSELTLPRAGIQNEGPRHFPFAVEQWFGNVVQ